MRFNQEKFKDALSGTPLKLGEVEKEGQCIYVYLVDSNIKYIRVHGGEFAEKNNCINIYHGESTKNGYWWDGELNYNKLVDELIKYNNPEKGLSMLEFKSLEEIFDHPEIRTETEIKFKGNIYSFKRQNVGCERDIPKEILNARVFRCDAESHELTVLYNDSELRYVETAYCRA